MAASHAAYLVAIGEPAEADVVQAIERHGGQHETMPEGVLVAGFDRVLDAVTCAVEALRARAEGQAHGRPPAPRIGVSEADPEAAAALAALAEPGGLCLSRTAYYAVRFQLELPYATEIGVDSTAYTCGEIRGKRKAMNLVDLSAVRVAPAALSGRGRDAGVLAKTKDLVARLRGRFAGRGT